LAPFFPSSQIKLPLCQVDLAQVVNEWRDVESNKEDDQYLGDICFSLRYVPTSGKVKKLVLREPEPQGAA
jgi:synaptotagmin-1